MNKLSNIYLVFSKHLFFIFYILYPLSALAQVIPDNTLPANSIVTQEGSNSNITGGSKAGNNLFHSFETFSIPTGGIAYFNNASDIQNIITRVTGKSISNIDGLIRANGTANLFLLNNNGIIFGQNARLDIGGSFIGTTANTIKFADGFQFNTTSTQTKPLLTVTVPIGLQWGSNSGTIQVQGKGHNLTVNGLFSPFIGSLSSNGLQVKPGKTLALVGGNLVLEGGKLQASGGRIELGSVAEGIVYLTSASNGWTLNYESVSSFKNIKASQQSIADASGSSAGSIQVQGADVQLKDGSVFFVQNQGEKLSGDINVNASESLQLLGTSPNGVISSGLVNETVIGNGGEIKILTKNLLVENGAAILARTYGNGRGGNVAVNASEIIKVTGGSSFAPQVPSSIVTGSFGSGDGGHLILSTKNLAVQDGGEILTSTFNTGRGGNLIVNTSESTQVIGYLSGVQFSRPISSTILTRASGSGNGGNLVLSTENLIAKEGGIIGSLTVANGNAGDVTINDNTFVELSGVVPNFFTPSSLTSATYSSGNSGKLTVNTKNLIISNGGVVNTSTRASGKAETLTINASDSIDVRGTATGSIYPSLINSSVVFLDEKFQQLYQLPPVPKGDSGDVIINTNNLNLADSALINVRNDGSGDAGKLQINANTVNVTNNGGITATTAAGQGGNIDINSKIVQLNNSIISATAGQQGTNGNGGSITIDTDILTASNNSAITANAFLGRGGNIRIDTQGLFLSPDTRITASSERGINGTVQINFQDRNPSQTKAQPEAIAQTPEVASVCQGRSGGVASSFVNVGTGGLPASPKRQVYSNFGWQENSIPQSIDNSEQPKTLVNDEPTILVEAQGWTLNSSGDVVLTAEANPVTANNSLSARSCSTVNYQVKND